MKTLVLLYPGCIEFEVMLAAEILHQKYPVEVKTPDGSDHVGSNGMVIKSQGGFSSIDPSTYKVVLVPGGDPRVLIGNNELNEKIIALHAQGTLLAAICAGPIVLEQAGLLKGKRIAHGYKEPQISFLKENGFFKETFLTDETVVVENRIVTARPDAFIDFAIEVAQCAGVIASDQVNFWKKYYRGESK